MFTRTLTIDSSGSNSRFHVSARPALQNTLSIGRIAAIVVPVGANVTNLHYNVTSDTITPVGWASFNILSGEATVFDSTGQNHGEVETAYDVANKLCYYPFSMNSGESVTTFFQGYGTVFKVWLREGGAWVERASATLARGDNQATAVAGAACDGIAIGLASPKGSGSFAFSFSVPPSADTSVCYDTFSTDAVTLGQVSQFRVTALSVLATFTGNQFNDGGVIAAARVRKGYAYNGLPYESLTQLTDHRYFGKAKEGAYTWWLPYSIDEMDFKEPADIPTETELRVAGIFDDADGQFQLTVSMVVEFYSPLQIFEHKIGPPITDDFERIYHALDSMDAATCNPSHSSIIKKALGKSANAAKGLAKTVASHPELLAALLAAV